MAAITPAYFEFTGPGYLTLVNNTTLVGKAYIQYQVDGEWKRLYDADNNPVEIGWPAETVFVDVGDSVLWRVVANYFDCDEPSMLFDFYNAYPPVEEPVDPPIDSSFRFTFSMFGEGEGTVFPSNTGDTLVVDIDWGDGSPIESVTTDDAPHMYALPGDYQVIVTGSCERVMFMGSQARTKITSVEQIGDLGWTSFNSMFSNCTALTSVTSGVTDTSAVSDFYGMFSDCTSLVTLPDVGTWDTASVTDCSNMFNNCSASVTTPNVSGWNVSSVVACDKMFGGCTGMTIAPDVSAWDTVSLASSINMFINCPAMTGLVISNWNVTSLTNAFSMFSEADAVLSTAEYDLILANWSSQVVLSGVQFGAGGVQHSASSQAAKDVLVNAPNSWIITDGGPV